MFSCREKLSDVQELGTEHFSGARVKYDLKGLNLSRPHGTLAFVSVLIAWLGGKCLYLIFVGGDISYLNPF